MRRAVMIAVSLGLAACGTSHEGEGDAGADAFEGRDAFGAHDAPEIDAWALDAGPPMDAWIEPIDAAHGPDTWPCGNGAMDPGEVCDDGNTISGDGCRADCLGNEQCGDGLADIGEVCFPDAPSTSGPIVNTGTPVIPFAGHALADVDLDGDVDVMFGLAGGSPGALGVAAMLNDGQGRLSSPVDLGVRVTGYPVFRVLDLNGDHAADFVASRREGPEIWLSDDAGGFASTPQVLTGLWLGVFADQDGDGDIDLIAADTTSERLVLLTNDGHGQLAVTQTFTLPITPAQAVSMHFDSDPIPDVLAIDAAGSGYVLLGRPGNTFAAPQHAMDGIPPYYYLAPEVGDLDGDGDDDLVVSGMTDATLVHNDGGRLVRDGQVRAQDFVYVARMDGDAAADIVGSFADVWLGTPSFGLRTPMSMPSNARTMGVADMNRDGANDIVALASPGTMDVYLANP